LRLAERARPRAFHGADLDITALDDFESGQHLLAKEFLSRGHECLGAQHLESIVGDLHGAEAALAAPDGQHDLAGNAVPLLHRGKDLAKAFEPATAAGDYGSQRFFRKVAARRAEFRLVLLP